MNLVSKKKKPDGITITTTTTTTERRRLRKFELFQTLSCLFHLLRFVLASFFWISILKDCIEVQGEEKKIVFVCSRPPQNVKLGTFTKYGARAVTANKMLEKKEKKKKRVASAKMLLLISKPIPLLTFSLPSPSLLLKLLSVLLQTADLQLPCLIQGRIQDFF